MTAIHNPLQPQPTPQRPLFLQALTLLFVAFQLAGIIAWPWFWVVAPIWANALWSGIKRAIWGIK
jgi:hypothetical protein